MRFLLASVTIGRLAVSPLRFSDVPVAAPSTGVTRVGVVANTKAPVPVAPVDVTPSTV